MRKVLILCLFFLSSPAFANPLYLLAGSSATAEQTYFLEENFEGTGYENTWVEILTDGTADEDYTPALRGSQSLRITSASSTMQKVEHTLSQPLAEAWGHFLVTTPPSATTSPTLIEFRSADDATVLGSIKLASTAAGGGVSVCKADSLCSSAGDIANQTVRVWWRWVKGTGSNGIIQAWISDSATTTRPGTVTAQVTDNGATLDVGRIYVASRYSSNAFVYDQVILHDSDFTTVQP